jgi:CRP-like cAMP-binding protein
MRTLVDELRAHPFFTGLSEDCMRLIAGCGERVMFRSGMTLASEGSAANEFYVIERGRVALQLHTSATGALLIQTLDAGDILGWSWLFPPFRWSVEARAMQDVHAIRLDGKCLRAKCDSDPVMGYALMQRFSYIMSQRVEATRLQVLDLYGRASRS